MTITTGRLAAAAFDAPDIEKEAAFYAYAYPEPDGCSAAPIEPAEASYHPQMREWILPYYAVRESDDPDGMVLQFFESTYTAAATLANWDTEDLRVAPPVSTSA